jgi:hypothetical protein
MATIIFSPPIIKIILSLAMVITAIGVTVWLIRDDIKKLKKMREQAERAERIWGRAGGRVVDKEDGAARLSKWQKKADKKPDKYFIGVDEGKPGGDMTGVAVAERDGDKMKVVDSFCFESEQEPPIRPKNKKRNNRHKGGGAK